MTTTYEKFDRIFDKLDAWAIIDKNGRSVGRFVVKHADMSVTGYLQIYGGEMVTARVNGCGFDRRGAALAKLAEKLPIGIAGSYRDLHQYSAANALRDLAPIAEGPGFESARHRLANERGIQFLHVHG